MNGSKHRSVRQVPENGASMAESQSGQNTLSASTDAQLKIARSKRKLKGTTALARYDTHFAALFDSACCLSVASGDELRVRQRRGGNKREGIMRETQLRCCRCHGAASEEGTIRTLLQGLA